MKIAIICYASQGGSGTLATELGLKLVKLGHQIHFISADVPYRLIAPWRRNVFYHEVETMQYPLFVDEPFDFALANKIYQVAEQYGIEVIHGHYAMPHFPAIYLAKEMLESKGRKIKTLMTFHGSDVYLVGEDPTLRDIVKFSVEKADGVTAVAKALAEDAQRIYDLKREIQVVPNFVTIVPGAEKSKELREIFAPQNEKIIAHISNFRQIKRIQDVIRLFAAIDKKVPSRLILIGDGPEKNTAYKISKQLNLLTRVHFLGLQTSIAKLLSIADLFILPSQKEGLPLSILEAMASAVPIIATNVCGIPELVKDGESGYLSEVGDIKKMSEDAIKILSDKKLHEKLSKKAKEVALKKYNWEKIVGQYEKIYKQLLKKN